MRARRMRSAVAACVAAIGLAAGQAGAADTGAHGAMAESAQQARLDKLLPPTPMVPPAALAPQLWEALVPADNEPTPARIELGRKLYFERRLSRDGTLSCATCHDVKPRLTS